MEGVKYIIFHLEQDWPLSLTYRDVNMTILSVMEEKKLSFSSCVFSDGNYLPRRIRDFVESYSSKGLVIVEEDSKVIYNQVFLLSFEAEALYNQIEYFRENSLKWQTILDDLSNQDLVFIKRN